MPTELDSRAYQTEQRRVLVTDEELRNRGGNIVETNKDILKDKDWCDRMEMAQEPVRIRIAPSTERFAAKHVFSSVNGVWAETWNDRLKRWVPTGWLEVGIPIIVRRYTVESLMRAKQDMITHDHDPATVAHPMNYLRRETSSVHAVQILEDRNPRSQEWFGDLMRQNG